jgi:hypothetical protein
MARRERNTTESSTPADGDSAVATLPEEAPMTAEVTEAPVETTDATTEVPAQAEPTTAEPSAEAAPAVEVDLTGFTAALTAAVEGRDTSTGDIPADLTEKVVAEYRALDGLKAKNAAKKAANDGIREAMNQMDIAQAKAYMTLADKLTAGSTGGGSAPKAPADPTEAFSNLVAGLQLALSLATSNVPEGVGENWSDKVTELVTASQDPSISYLAWVNREPVAEGVEDAPEPEVSDVVKSAVKLALGKSARVGGAARRSSGGGTSTPYTGERRDIGKHISEAFAAVESGTFLTVAEIRKFDSSQYTSESPASAGAISSRLFPQTGACTVEGIVPGTNDKGNRGATKA